MTTYTFLQIELKAEQKGLSCSTSIPNRFKDEEYLVVDLKFGVCAFFLMDNETFDFTYSHTYNALNDKTTKRTPSFLN
jgi:hypothetical protein